MKRNNYTTDIVNIEGLTDSQIMLITKLNTKIRYDVDDPKDSIMHYEQLCNHDDGFLCECRLQYIIDWLKINK